MPLWDVTGFYDNMKASVTVRCLQKEHFPADAGVLGMLHHLEPRTLMVSGTAAPTITPVKSIIAGCSSSTSIARAVLRGPVLEAHSLTQQNIHPAASEKLHQTTGQHVDDLGQLTTARSELTVYKAALFIGRQ